VHSVFFLNPPQPSQNRPFFALSPPPLFNLDACEQSNSPFTLHPGTPSIFVSLLGLFSFSLFAHRDRPSPLSPPSPLPRASFLEPEGPPHLPVYTFQHIWLSSLFIFQPQGQICASILPPQPPPRPTNGPVRDVGPFTCLIDHPILVSPGNGVFAPCCGILGPFFFPHFSPSIRRSPQSDLSTPLWFFFFRWLFWPRPSIFPKVDFSSP